uniref:Phosphotransferase system cellobiose-specific component IIA n=1 Tax=uncultured bacterium contig00006 TaxID=1181498 RepID=A0A806KBR1_9BACT|nr:phosphotransferase system cellobiose-specific component IIA [uncultured bacterium contig00006]
MLNDERLEDMAMLIIANAGAARGAAFEALSQAKRGDFTAAAACMKTAEDYSHAAHDAHSGLLKLDAKGEVPQLDLLLTHSQDHLLCAALAMDLIAEIVQLRREFCDMRALCAPPDSSP